jgi:hypothetical protein
MKKLFALVLLTFLLSTGKSFAQLYISRWTFEGVTTTNTGTTPTFSTGSAVADVGARTTGSSCTGFHVASATTWSNPSGNGSAKSLSSNNWAVGDYLQFQTNSLSCSGISLAWDQTGSTTGPSQFKVQYSTDGNNFTDGISYTVPVQTANTAINWSSSVPNSISTVTTDLSAITALNNQPNIYFRLVCTGTTSISGGSVATTGTGRIDNFTVFGNTVAPLTLSFFKASLVNNKASLTWNTTNEINVSGFAIEKSSNGNNYNQIDFVAGKNATANSYSYIDATAITSTTYYRLKMADKDGSFKYSNVVAINAKQSIKLDVFPNPVVSTAILSHTKASNTATIKVVTLEGRTLATYNVQDGATQTSIDVSKLSTGTYVLVFNNNGNSSFTKMVKL